MRSIRKLLQTRTRFRYRFWLRYICTHQDNTTWSLYSSGSQRDHYSQNLGHMFHLDTKLKLTKNIIVNETNPNSFFFSKIRKQDYYFICFTVWPLMNEAVKTHNSPYRQLDLFPCKTSSPCFKYFIWIWN